MCEFVDAQVGFDDDTVLRYASSRQTHMAQAAIDDKQLVFCIPCSSPGEVFSELMQFLLVLLVNVSNLAFV